MELVRARERRCPRRPHARVRPPRGAPLAPRLNRYRDSVSRYAMSGGRLDRLDQVFVEAGREGARANLRACRSR